MTRRHPAFGIAVLACMLLVGCGRSSGAANASNVASEDDDADATLGETQDDSADIAGHDDGSGGDARSDTGDVTADTDDAGEIAVEADISVDADTATATKGDVVVPDAGGKPTADAGADAGTEPDVSSQPDAPTESVDAGLPTAEPASASCKDKRHRNDHKQKGDYCWAPPQHYCSPGEGAMLWFGCAPDQSACCLFDSFCRPCGWHQCPFVPKGAPPPTTLPPGCPTYFVLDKPSATVPLECQPYTPNDTEFCWDNAPEEWKTYDFHIHDGDL